MMIFVYCILGLLYIVKNSEEILEVCIELGIEAKVLSKDDSVKIIKDVFEKYNVQKKTGHLAIWTDSLSIPLEEHEFSYSNYLKDEPVYMFFGQKISGKKEEVVVIDQAKQVGKIMENSYGMEYFLTNQTYSFLLAVNWYVIEGAGEALDWIGPLAEDNDHAGV